MNNKQYVMEHNDHIEFGLVSALYSNDESSICDIKTENLNSVGGFLLKRFVISSYITFTINIIVLNIIVSVYCLFVK